MEPEVSLPCSQSLANGTCTEQVESNPYPHTLFSKIHFNIILPSIPRSVKFSDQNFA